MSAVTIEVTAEDIAKGRRRDCWKCPVALAAERALGSPAEVGVEMLTAGGASWGLPRAAQYFIQDFDYGVDLDTLAPFSFTLEIPS